MFTEGNRKFLYIAGGIFLLFILIIVVVLVKGGGNKKTTTGDGTLTIWGTENDTNAFTDIIENFQSANNVKVTYVKKDSATYLNDSLAEIAAGKGPDVWMVPNTWMPKYHNQMVAMPDNLIADKKAKKNDVEVYKSAFPNVIVTDNIIGDKIYGMPISADTLRLYYNNELFGSAYSTMNQSGNVSDSDQQLLSKGPQNWDQFTRAAQLLTKKSGNAISQSGVAMGTSNITNANDILTLLMLQYGTKMTSDDNASAQFQTAQNLFGGASFPGAKALDFYASFSNPNNANYSWNDSLGDSVRAFAEGKTTMMIGYKSQEADIKRINPNLQYQTINIPQVKETKNPVNYASYNTFSVTKATKDSALAWNFILAIAYSNNGSGAQSYLSATKKEPALKQKTGENDPIITAKNWHIPDPIKTPAIFKEMIKQVNEGKNSQTAIENAASQVTTLLKQLK